MSEQSASPSPSMAKFPQKREQSPSKRTPASRGSSSNRNGATTRSSRPSNGGGQKRSGTQSRDKQSSSRSHGGHGQQRRSPSRIQARVNTRAKDRKPDDKRPINGEAHDFPKSASKGFVKVTPLGGLEEIGSNMMVIEYEKDIIIVDVGNQFPNEDMHGIDLIIPNTKYLEGRESDIKGVVFTHGHLDHIGAVPYIIPRIGNPPMYANDMTAAMIKKKNEEFKGNPKQNITVIDKTSKIDFGKIQVEFFHVTHSFPNSLGVVIKTPAGNVVMTGDFKMDLTPEPDEPLNFSRLTEVANMGVDLLLSDSTGATREGYALSELKVKEEMQQIFDQAKGRIIIATFSSLITRLQQVIKMANQMGRKVVIEGYSMRTNIEIAKKLGYVDAPQNTFISAEDSTKLPDNKVLILSTGAQGEGNAALMRIATGEHRTLDIHKDDLIVLSSSVIPGNERTVQALMDNIIRKGAKIINYEKMDIHASGHGYQGDLRMMLAIMKPKHFIPVHGTYHMMRTHIQLATSVGVPLKNCRLITNGTSCEVNKNEMRVLKKKVPAEYVMVDGLGVGDVGNVVLRDRQQMAEDGMFTIIVIVDGKKGEVVGSPDIISRGFIYMKESRDILTEVRKKTVAICKTKLGKDHTTNFNYIKDNIRDKIGQYLFTKTERRPMVLPVIIEV